MCADNVDRRRVWAQRVFGLWLLGGGFGLASGCLEKQDDSEITISGSYGGVGGEAGSANVARVGDLASQGAAGASHAAVAHEDRPSGFDDTSGAVPAGPVAPPPGEAAPGEAPAGATGGGVPSEPAPVAHNDVPHVDRPAGFGQDGQEPAPAPAGSPGGAPVAVPAGVLSPFEREAQGKPMVVVSGALTLTAGGSGVVDIDCFVPDESSPAKRRFVNKIKAQAPGTFQMKVPSGYGPLIVSAFLDQDGDGPDPADPQATYAGNPFTVGDKDISGIDLVLGAAAAPPPQ